MYFFFFFFNDTATTEIYTLSLHDALPICRHWLPARACSLAGWPCCAPTPRSEEHTSELQSPCNLVCRLLLEKKKNTASMMPSTIPARNAAHWTLRIQHRARTELHMTV